MAHRNWHDFKKFNLCASAISLKKITQTSQKIIFQMIEVGAWMMCFGNSSMFLLYFLKNQIIKCILNQSVTSRYMTITIIEKGLDPENIYVCEFLDKWIVFVGLTSYFTLFTHMNLYARSETKAEIHIYKLSTFYLKCLLKQIQSRYQLFLI